MGASVIVDTTGVGHLIEEAFESLSSLGKMVHIAPTPPDYKLKIDTTALLMVSLSSKTVGLADHIVWKNNHRLYRRELYLERGKL